MDAVKSSFTHWHSMTCHMIVFTTALCCCQKWIIWMKNQVKMIQSEAMLKNQSLRDVIDYWSDYTNIKPANLNKTTMCRWTDSDWREKQVLPCPSPASDDRNHSQLTFIPKLWHPLTCRHSRQPSRWLMRYNQTNLSQNNVSAGGNDMEFTLIEMTSVDTVTECWERFLGKMVYGQFNIHYIFWAGCIYQVDFKSAALAQPLIT